MSANLSLISEAAHLLGVLPLAVILIAGRRLPLVYGWVAFGLAVSWVGDSIGHLEGGSSWFRWEWWPLTQFAVLIWGLGKNTWRDVGMLVVLIAAATSIGFTARPDWILAVTGAVVVLALARGPVAGPLWVYFGAGTGAYLWMIQTINTNIWPAWLTYQGCRAVAVAWFAAVVIGAREPNTVSLAAHR